MNYSKLLNLTKNFFTKLSIITLVIDQPIISYCYADDLPIIIDGTTNTQIVKTNSGVDQINIATPDANGLSHNKFESYNVNINGQILNNVTLNDIQNQSNITEIGGSIDINQNLNDSGSAKIILNEVTSTNVSNLLGFVEIAGAKADLIIANPNGITCSGCGFINTSRLAMVAGSSFIEGEDLKFNLTKQINPNLYVPLITIDGLGLNATKTSATEIIASTVKILSSIYGSNENSIAIKTGEGIIAKNTENEFEISQSTQENPNEISNSGNEPLFAIDSSSLAKIQAGQIYLIATKEGVGVKMESDILASKTLTINADGDIYYNNINATEKISLQSNNTIKSLSDKSSINSENVEISSKNFDNFGKIFAKNIELKNINKFDNYGNIEALNLKLSNIVTLNNYKNIFGTNSLETSIDNLSNYSLGIISSNQDYSINIKNNLLNEGLIISNNNLDIKIGENLLCLLNENSCDFIENQGILVNNGQIIANSKLNIVTNNFINNSGNINANDISLLTLNKIENNAKIISANNLELTAKTINNLQEIFANNDLTLIAEDIENSGDLLSNNDQYLYLLSNLDNSGNINASGNININGANVIDNYKNIFSNKDIFVTANIFNNFEAIKSGKELYLNLSNLNNDGNIFAKELMDISTSISTINNNIIKSANNLKIKSENIINNDSSLILAENNINIDSTNINNFNMKPLQDIESGIVSANGTIDINAKDYILTGNITANNINIKGNNIKNEGNILAKNFIKLIATGNDENSNDGNIFNGNENADNSNVKLLAGNYIDLIAKRNIENFATISANKNLTLTADLGSIKNYNSISNDSEKITINAINGDFNNANLNSLIIANNNADFNVKNFDNFGNIFVKNDLKTNITDNFTNNKDASIKSDNNAIFNVAENFLNDQGKIYIKNNLTIQKNELGEKTNILTNISGEIETHNGDITINANTINNKRSAMKTQKFTYWESECNSQDDGCYYDSSYIASISGRIGINSKIDSGKNIFLNSNNLTNNSGTIEASNEINISPTIIQNIDNKFESFQNYLSNWREDQNPYSTLISTKPANAYMEEHLAYLTAGGKLNYTQLDLTNPITLNANNIAEFTNTNSNSYKTSSTEFVNIPNYILTQNTSENIDLTKINEASQNIEPILMNNSNQIIDDINGKFTNANFATILPSNSFNPNIKTNKPQTPNIPDTPSSNQNPNIPDTSSGNQNPNIADNSSDNQNIEEIINEDEDKDIIADIDHQTRISNLININENNLINRPFESSIINQNNINSASLKNISDSNISNIHESLSLSNFKSSNINKSKSLIANLNSDDSLITKANLSFNFPSNSKQNSNSLISKIIAKNSLSLASNIENIKIGSKMNLSNSLGLDKLQDIYLKYNNI